MKKSHEARLKPAPGQAKHLIYFEISQLNQLVRYSNIEILQLCDHSHSILTVKEIKITKRHSIDLLELKPA